MRVLAWLGVICLSAMGEAPTTAVVTGNTSFAFDLYHRLRIEPGNLFVSPYSLSTALALTYAGARGDTATQMADVLGFPADPAPVAAAVGDLQRQLGQTADAQGVQLSVANALWAQQDKTFLPAFLGAAQNAFEANVAQVDFMAEAETARNQINQWVAQQTQDKIQEILPSGSVDALTRLVLANAIYFKGAWTKPFDPGDTATKPFYPSAATEVAAPLMHKLDSVPYMETNTFQAVELPYTRGGFSMVILLPRDVDGTEALEEELSPELLSAVLAQMQAQDVDVFLPRFTLQSGFRLNDTLAEMGMPDAFTPGQADFSGMDGDRDLSVSGVFHKAWGEINEAGTEAAAATAVGVGITSVPVNPTPPAVFRADHPFTFLIRDTNTGSILFLGRLVDPTR